MSKILTRAKHRIETLTAQVVRYRERLVYLGRRVSELKRENKALTNEVKFFRDKYT
jgi:predicted RNase H-like nuclease (RuvC/YqgF family)